MPPITISDFSNLAAGIKDSQSLKVTDSGNLAKTHIFTFQSRKREAINAFVGALRNQFGDNIANMLDQTKLSGLKAAGKPLTARLVKDFISQAAQAKYNEQQEAIRTREQAAIDTNNRAAVNKFLSGEDPKNSLDKAVDEFCAKFKVTHEGDKAALKENLRNVLTQEAQRGGYYGPMRPEDFQRGIATGNSLVTGYCSLEDLAPPSPGALRDMMRLEDSLKELGLDGKARERALGGGALGEMRKIQPEGDLTLQTVYKALMKDDPPAGLSEAKLAGALKTFCSYDKAVWPSIRQMTGTVANTFKTILTAQDGRAVADLLNSLAFSMRSTTSLNPKFVRGFAGADEGFFTAAQTLAMRMGLLKLMDGDKPATFQALTRPGPFRDMLYDLARDQSEEGGNVRQALDWFKGGLAGILPDGTLAKLDPQDIRERDLSLPRQREILGEGNYTVRGAEGAMPGLAGLNAALRRDMPAMQDYLHGFAGRLLRQEHGSSGELGLSTQFHKDFHRDGVFVNGRYYSPKPVTNADPTARGTATSAQDFIDLFPDARTAVLLSRLATQSMRVNVQGDTISAAPKATQDMLEHLLLNPLLVFKEHSAIEQNTRIDTLNAAQGQYRVTGFFARATTNPNSGVERFMYEIAVDVNLGAPGADPPPEPTVENTRLDWLIRGREAAPGE
ncbi:MAG: hypothetical protein FWG97_02645 [Deltaproteobacteria bacterium]|nr:hypothetical protein [Deltaproteobacteria bacterium]